MTPQEAQLFNIYMSLILLKKAKENMKKGDIEKLKEISKIGMIYSFLCVVA